jgi:endoglucanase
VNARMYAFVLLLGCSTRNAELARASVDATPPRLDSAAAEVSPELAALGAAQDAVLKAEAAGAPPTCQRWPLWERYAAQFVAADGRVIDHTSDARTTSEGQAYGLLFALIADDRARFELLLRWLETNLAQGDLHGNLPAWHWGKRDDGSWGVKDPNAASDADVWTSYALLEAARLWQEPRYRELGMALAKNIATQEVAQAAGLGTVLLPGPEGFVGEHGKLRLNPSYLALPPLRRLEKEHPAGPWRAVIASSVRVLGGSAPRGLAPDWIAYQPGQGFQPDEHNDGSYDAVRVYLWSTLLSERDPQARNVRRASDGLLKLLQSTGRMPERIDTRSAEVSANDGPPGFVAVALAYAQARGDSALLRELRARLDGAAFDGLYGKPPAYYDQNLALFALGMIEGRYRFAPDGRLLLPRNEDVCAPQ